MIHNTRMFGRTRVWMGLAIALGVAAVMPLVSCGEDGSPESTYPPDATAPDAEESGPLAGLVELSVSPATADLEAGEKNGSQAFTARGKFKDGSERDVTGLVTWRSSADTLITMDGPTAKATGQHGGEASVSASGGAITGIAKVRVKYTKVVYGAGAAPGSIGRFSGTEDAGLAPQLAYPLDGAMIPPNFAALEVQWRYGVGTDLYDVVFASPLLDLHVVTTCTSVSSDGCGLVLDAASWTAVTRTLAGADPATVRVRAAAAAGGSFGVSGPASIQLAKSDIRGGLYYFNTYPAAGEKAGIYRYDFEKDAVGSFYTAGNCAGCHALSTDGTKMLAPICDHANCERPMQLAVVDVATKAVVTPAMPVGDSDTVAWSPDNKLFVTTPTCGTFDPGGRCATDSGGVLRLVDATTGASLGDAPIAKGALYPTFSNDGKQIAFARAGAYRGPLSMHRSSIRAVDFDASKSPPTWGAERDLVTASGADYENNYYPAFSPDDAWVAFARSFCKAGDNPDGDINESVCDTYDDPTARVMVVPAKGGPAVDLARANGTGRLKNSWPKWSPFKGSYKGGDIYWLTISSARDYGLRVKHTQSAQGNPQGNVQLWLVAFDPARAAAGLDPSFAPVWLPFQSVASSNHIGQWTTKIVGPIK